MKKKWIALLGSALMLGTGLAGKTIVALADENQKNKSVACATEYTENAKNAVNTAKNGVNLQIKAKSAYLID